MFKSKSIGSALEIQLPEDYVLLAVLLGDKHNFDVCVANLYIKKSDIDIYDYIDMVVFDDLEGENLRKEFTYNIENMYKDGFFDYYIKRYDEMMNIMALGYERWDELHEGE